jgi:hypothetical protein
MPRIAQRTFFGGTEAKISRLGLSGTWKELENLLTGFGFYADKRRTPDGGNILRNRLDGRFRSVDGWEAARTRGVDWTRCHRVQDTRVCVGVEIQLSASAKSDLLLVDLQRLRDEITGGRIDIGVMVVPSDKLAQSLTNGVARNMDAIRAVERATASYLPLAVLALDHDGPGPALMKRQTRQGKKR